MEAPNIVSCAQCLSSYQAVLQAFLFPATGGDPKGSKKGQLVIVWRGRGRDSKIEILARMGESEVPAEGQGNTVAAGGVLKRKPVQSLR